MRGIKLGNATEHSYRGDLERLISSIVTDVVVTNEPSRIDCGAPDYIITKNKIPIGYIEAKDIGDSDLYGKKANKEQFDRYKKSLNNLIITDYLDFQLFLDGKLVTSVKIAEINGGKIVPISENFEQFTDLITEFCTYVGQTIKSASKLSKMMASKAKMLESVIEQAVTSDEDNEADSTLKEQMKAFKEVLIHDIKPSEFADIYAQTIAYGMFAARLHDPTLEDFSRQEAAALIPQSNPFLRKLFQYIAGYDLDDRISWIVDALADVFKYTDVAELLKDFGSATQQNDPMIHFYETFLAEYNPKLRKKRGVYYTPEPIVNFIVRAVDDILKSEFGLSKGLADTSTTTIKLDTQTPDKKSPSGYKQVKQKVHKVQILDPAVGTGTFLTEIIKHIYKGFEGQQGIWSKYVEDHLIPRLHGFEILMASYSMAHLKLELLLQQTGYKPTKQQRLRIYLTNSLEKQHPDMEARFANWLSIEANEANHIKRDSPVMVILGNPPYSVSSRNKGKWIQKLLSDYKKDLNERKINIDDDYIKFIRYGQHYIDKNGEGILAYISNNSFIDGITHRQMRKHLLETFDKIYIIDLHGNSNKKEKSPDGSKDENVFDIQQGVSISLFIKNGKTKKQIYHYDCFGSRLDKYSFLFNNSISNISWSKVIKDSKYQFFTAKNIDINSDYTNYISTIDLFKLYNSGIQTKRDKININFTESDAIDILNDFKNLDEVELINKYQLPKDGRDWKINLAKMDALSKNLLVYQEQYRPFDYRYSFYTGNSKGMVAYPRKIVSEHIIQKDNYAICLMRQFFQDSDYSHILASNVMVDERTMYSNRGGTYIFPLYTYNQSSEQLTIDDRVVREHNLNEELVSEIAEKLGLSFTSEKEKSTNKFAPIDILDYIYAVLHSPIYRDIYKEFLKIDFPRVPYPTDKKTFWKLVKIGSEIRQIHLLESAKVEKYITTYPVDGDNTVTRKLTTASPGFELTNEKKDLGKVWINDKQYFDKVPQTAWNFYIGGYQPAQKWLKDRKDRELSVDDVAHYQKIIVALTETDKLMKEVDKVGVEW